MSPVAADSRFCWMTMLVLRRGRACAPRCWYAILCFYCLLKYPICSGLCGTWWEWTQWLEFFAADL